MYLVTNTQTGKQYVGCTIGNSEKRWRQHVSIARRGLGHLLHKAIRKYGVDVFMIEEIEEVHGEHADLLAAETRVIDARKTIVPDGYNLTSGGQAIDFKVPEVKAAHLAGVRRRSERQDWRRANSEAQKRYFREHPELRIPSDEWLATTTARNRDLAKNPAWREALRIGIEIRSSSAEWKQNLIVGAAKRKANPSWVAGMTAALAKARQASAERLRERDKLLSPEEFVLRIKRREAVRRSAAKRTAERGPRRRVRSKALIFVANEAPAND